MHSRMTSLLRIGRSAVAALTHPATGSCLGSAPQATAGRQTCDGSAAAACATLSHRHFSTPTSGPAFTTVYGGVDMPSRRDALLYELRYVNDLVLAQLDRCTPLGVLRHVEDEIMRGHLSESPARGAPAAAGRASAQLDVWQHFIASNPLLAALLADSMGEPLDRIPSMAAVIADKLDEHEASLDAESRQSLDVMLGMPPVLNLQEMLFMQTLALRCNICIGLQALEDMPDSLFRGLEQFLTVQPMERLLQAATMRLLRLRGAVAVSGLWDHIVLDMLSKGALDATSRGEFEAEWEAAAGEPRSRPIMSVLASVMQWNPDTETIKKLAAITYDAMTCEWDDGRHPGPSTVRLSLGLMPREAAKASAHLAERYHIRHKLVHA